MNFPKRTGIITWHNYPGFGSVLQAYALFAFINGHGGNATIINYVPKFKPKLGKLRYLLSRLDPIIPHFLTVKLNYGFIYFEKRHLKETREVHTTEELQKLNTQFDNFVCGSDQIWAPNVFEKNYFLAFAPNDKNKVSYAASIGLSDIPPDLRDKYKTLIGRLDYVSVRERQGADLLKRLFGIEAQVVLDPTLLLRPDDWRTLLPKRNKRVESGYVLCYFLGKTGWHRDYAASLARSRHKKLVCLSNLEQDIANPDFGIVRNAGPQDFLAYVSSSDMVLTDSYHGILFSLIFGKQFLCFERFKQDDAINQNSRVYNILALLKLESRLVKAPGIPTTKQQIDYQQVRKRLSVLREQSVAFLKEAGISR